MKFKAKDFYIKDLSGNGKDMQFSPESCAANANAKLKEILLDKRAVLAKATHDTPLWRGFIDGWLKDLEKEDE